MPDDLEVLLDFLSQALGVEFDPMLAHESAHSALREFPGPPSATWAPRATQAGKRAGIRFLRLSSDLNSLTRLSGPDHPAITYVPGNASRPGRWLIVSRRDVQQLVEGTDAPTPIPRGEARKLLDASTSPEWLLAQRLLPCVEASVSLPPQSTHGVSGHDEHHSELSPHVRLLRLMKPERGDVLAVILYALGVGVLSLATPLAIEALVMTVALNQIVQQLVTLSVILLLCLSLAALLKGMQIHLVEMLQRRLFTRLASDLAYRLPRVRADFYDLHYGPELVNRFFEILTIQKVSSALLLDAVSIVLGAFFGMIVLAFYHPFLLGYDVFLLLLMAFCTFWLGRGAIHNAIEESKAKYSLAGELQEIARSPLAFKVDGAADFAMLRTDAFNRRYLMFRGRHWSILFRQIGFALAVQAFATAALLGLGGWLVINEALNLGQLVAAELIVATVLAGFAKMGKHLESWYDLMAAMDKVGYLLDMPLERQDGDRLADDESQGPAGLVVRHLRYAYDHHHPVLNGLDLSIDPGERVALVGPSGSGKSTLADVVFGLRDPSSGSILVGDQNTRDLDLACLRRQVAYVSQRLEILEEPILENVRVGRGQISLRDVRHALDSVGLLEEVDRLPDGIATHLSFDGGPLSAGQARRLVLARAIVGRPRLLIIDEALDGLEIFARERTIQAVYDREAPWTLVVITHDQEIAQLGDRAIALSGGRADRSVSMIDAHPPRIEDWLQEVQTWRAN